MSGPIPAIPLHGVQAAVGEALNDEHVKASPHLMLIALSIAEYLKDAERWQFYMRNGPILGGVDTMTPAELTKYVDQEIDNERKRLVRTRQGRKDGVQGGGGARGAPDPVV